METIRDAWAAFVDLHGGEMPAWTLDRLRKAIHAHGWRYGDLDSARLGSLMDDEITEETTAARKAAAALGRLGGKAGRGASQVRGDSDHYRAIRAKRRPLSYVARSLTGGWVTMHWDAAREIYVEGAQYRSQREGRDAIREQRARG